MQHHVHTCNKGMTGNREILKTRWPPVAILDFTGTLITFEPLVRLSSNLAGSFVLTPPRHRKGQKCHFSKSKMAADETGNTFKNGITSERFSRFAPNLVCSIYASRERCQPSRKPEIRNTRWPPAAILDFTRTLITFEPLVRLSPNLVCSFVLAPPRHRRGQKCHFSKSKMAADETGNTFRNGIASEWFI